MDRRLLRNFDITLLLVALAILPFGCLMIYSASKGGSAGLSHVQRQLMWVPLGLIVGAIAASLDCSVFQRIAGKLYWINLFLLAGVLVAGMSSKGAQRWIGYGPIRVQPSEFAKVILIIALASFLVKRIDTIRTSRTFVASLLYLSVPILLVFKQPDLGTSLVLLGIWMTMLFVMGTDVRNILVFIAVCAVGGYAVFHIPGVLKDYQKNRLISFVNPDADPRGSGYQVTQSRIAIGSGQLTGKGFLRGTQREARFVPEQHTDFIFTVVGEELGFVGCAALLALYFTLVWRGLDIMAATEDSMARAIAAGVVGMFVFHIVVNIGMTLGIMPVTGVPLPMFSYGGSSLLANMVAIGLLEGISMRRHKIAF